MVKPFKNYLWGFYFKGSSYHEFRFPNRWTLMVPHVPHKTTKWYREYKTK